MQAPRRQFDANPGLARILVEEATVEFVELFLVHFCALGVRMTEFVESWIRRAGNRCEEIGLVPLGRALRKHAIAESGHHLMMIRDVDWLVERWNSRHTDDPLDGEALQAIQVTPGVQRYIDVHESNIVGPTPYAQVAIEYEIEMLPLRHGQRFVQKCIAVCGPEIIKGLSFLTEHIEIDVSHTKFNGLQLGKVLEEDPNRLPVLVQAGSAALQAYAEFLQDCLALTESRIQRQ
ncbi:MAG TPA: hypothetical protein VGZ47_14075 [Gemmataceae bacterium]|nr:hypothetical protein [Gemmataceae bacterium]